MQRLFRWAVNTEKEEFINILKEVPLLKGLHRNFLRKLLIDLIEKKYSSGDVIFAEGEAGKAVYIVLQGSVIITKATQDSERVLARLETGSYFGELALIDEAPRFATVTAEEQTTLLIMYKSYFDNIIRTQNSLSNRILMNIAGSFAAYIRKIQAVDSDRKQGQD